MSKSVSFPVGSDSNESNPWNPCVGKIWRRAWQPTPVFLPAKPRGQRSLAGYSPWGRKELDTTEWLSTAQSNSVTSNWLVVISESFSIIYLWTCHLFPSGKFTQFHFQAISFFIVIGFRFFLRCPVFFQPPGTRPEYLHKHLYHEPSYLTKYLP